MKRFRKDTWRRVGTVCLLLCLCVCFAACRRQPGVEPTDPQQTQAQTQEPVDYALQVQSAGGLPLEDLTVYIYADSTLADLVAVVKTDSEGKASFSYNAGDGYVAVLTDVPQGYVALEQYPVTQSTVITLEVELVAGELDNVSYKLGDVMQDFTFTDVDGKEYKLSELLMFKKAVVLNFWYTECNPCKMEFPYLQEAYAEYSDVLEVLAIDPVEQDNALIKAFAQERGLTFPVGAGDPAWGSAMPLTFLGYPTTVVIDRYGMIAMIHGGSVTNAQNFKDVFAFFTDPDYVQTTVNSMEELFVTEPDPEAVENPVDISGQASFELTLDPGQVHYVNIHKMMNVWLQVDNSYIYAEYGDKTYTPSNGSIGFLFSAPSTFEPAQIGFGNDSDERQTFTVHLSNLPGSYENPYTMQVGEFTASVSAGNDQGVYFTYTASEDGYFKLRCTAVSPSGTGYGVNVHNLISNAFMTISSEEAGDAAQDGYLTMPMNVGEKLRISIAAMPDESHNYPAATFTMQAKFDAGEVEDIVQKEKAFYAVTVTDENAKPVSGVGIQLNGSENSRVSMQTDENGVASALVDEDSYTGTLIVPAGYQANTTQFELDPDNLMLSLKLDTVYVAAKEAYTVRVTDNTGAAVPNVVVVIGSTFGTTDTNGVYTAQLEKGTYTVMIVVPSGYTANSIMYTFPENDTTLGIVLKKGSSGQDTNVGGDGDDGSGGTGGSGGVSGGDTDGTGGNTGGETGGGSSGGGTLEPPAENELTYSVKLVDMQGYPVTGVVVTFSQGGIPMGIATVNASGYASKNLVKGAYSISLISSRGDVLVYDEAEVTQKKPSVTVTVVGKPDHSTNQDTYYWGNSYRLYEGSTKLDLINQTNYNADYGCWMYVFYPASSGEYRFTVSGGAELGYYGSVNFLNKNKTTAETGSFTVTVRDGEFSNDTQPLLVVGVVPKGNDKAPTVTVSRVADAPEELPVTVYTPAKAPTEFDLKETGTVTYINLEGTASIQKGRDGYYYLNGKKLYVNIGNGAPYITMANLLGLQFDSSAGTWGETSMGTGLKGYIYEGDEIVGKEDFTACMQSYVKACDPVSGLYPLNDDLMYMFKQAGSYMGWWNVEHPNFLFEGLTKLNTQIAWMFACCYLD
ncbi:MAG: redoxin domain-containing protein [Oscillospiraceae bacterium]|nr:redoxin domain-containing protein [Oscillospiraceae bacterium]